MGKSRIPLVAGNWKMHTLLAEAASLIDEMIPHLLRFPLVESVICPPYISLATLATRLEGTGIKLGAQDLYWEDSGAFTGEISGPMLQGICAYAVIGHSERRKHFGESDETVRRKVAAALRHGLRPIVCVGESLDEREAGVAAEVVARQLRRAMDAVPPTDVGSVVIAYEPVWAIGTGRAATPDSVHEIVGGVIRPLLFSRFDEKAAGQVRVIYGGSVTASNAAEFFKDPDVDGGLVGGASLRAEEFAAIVAAAT